MALGTAFKSVVSGLFPEAATNLRKTLGGMEVDTIDEGMLSSLKDPELIIGPQGVASMMQKVNPEAKATLEKEMKIAYDMMYRGESMSNIEARTGFFFDDQGKILKEIDDNAATLKKTPAELNKEKEYNLDEVFEHKPFFTVYPDLAKTRIRFYKGVGKENNAEGYFDVKNGVIGININRGAFIDATPDDPPDPTTLTSTIRTILHESQHLIQQLEGLDKGGSPEMFKKGGSSGLNLPDTAAYQRYLKLIGEAMARNVEIRYGKKKERDFLKTLATDPVSIKNNVNKYRLIKNTGVPYKSVSQPEIENVDYQDPFQNNDLSERMIP
jgi:hypothetical protein